MLCFEGVINLVDKPWVRGTARMEHRRTCQCDESEFQDTNIKQDLKFDHMNYNTDVYD